MSDRNSTTERVKIVKNSRFLFKIPGFSRLFFKIYQIPGVSIPGKMATLNILL